MPPQLALLICSLFIYWLLAREIPKNGIRPDGLWVSGLWLFVISSRPVGYWFIDPGETINSSEGNPINLVVMAILIVSGILVLKKRSIDWRYIATNNKLLLCLYFYFLVSFAWSEFPATVVKRIIKDSGCVVCAAILVSSGDVGGHLKKLVRRCAYIIFPLSFVYIKWFPEIGRRYSVSGEPMYCGITLHKNTLGQVIAIFSIVLIWDYVESRKNGGSIGDQSRKLRDVIVLVLGIWLLSKAGSATATLVYVLGIGILLAGRWILRCRSPKRAMASASLIVVFLLLLNNTLGISASVLSVMGRDTSLTGRIEIWDAALAQDFPRLTGTGYMSYWESRYGREAIDTIGVPVQTVHNGYLETFLDGGWIGVGIIILMILSRGAFVYRRFFHGHAYGRLALALFWVAIVYNYSESSFLRLDLIWFMLILSTVDFQTAKFRGMNSLQMVSQHHNNRRLAQNM